MAARGGRWVPGGLVLLYHRVVSLDLDPQELAVTPERFSAHLDVLQRRGVPMSLPGLMAAARRNDIPTGAFAITFDDGYADVLEVAAPLLVAAGIPATVFVTAGLGEHEREFWWDELERYLLTPGTLPSHVRIPIDGVEREWEVSRPEDRYRVYAELCAVLRDVSVLARMQALDTLRAMTDNAITARPTHRRLSRQQIVELSRLPGFTIGSHSMSHPALSARPAGEQLQELAGGKQALEWTLRMPVTSLAYPFGDAGEARVDGVTLACTTEPASVGADTDPLRIPRLLIGDWTGEEFSARWSAWTRH